MDIKIKLELKGVTIELTPDEAKALVAALRGLVEKEIVYTPSVYIPSVWPIYDPSYRVMCVTTSGATDDRIYTVSVS